MAAGNTELTAEIKSTHDQLQKLEVAFGEGGTDRLPKGWVTTQIDSVAEIKGGKRLPKGKKLTVEVTAHPYIRVTDFDNGGVDLTKILYVDEETYAVIKNYTISKNDLYISIAGTIGLVGEIPDILNGANLTENAAKICHINGATKNYLKYVLNSSMAKSQFEDKTTSSGQPKLALFRIKDCQFPLPPLAEQTVIAQTLDTLLAQVDNIKTRLDAIPKILKTFRQSVLAAAVSGKLTEEWRGENECSVWDEYEFETLLREMRNGLSPKPNENEIGHPIFRISAVRPLEIDYSDMRYLECENKIAERYRLRKNDLLFTRYNGSLDFVGVCGMIKEEPKGVILYPDKLIRVRLKENVHPSYIELYFASPSIRKLVTDFVKSTSGQKGISGKDLKSVLVALPSFKEQTEIVRRVEELFAFADQIEQQVKNAQGRVNNLTQSILAKAFRGELTAQWRAENPDLISGDNSAKALLAKIQEERDALKQKAKPKKKCTAKKTKKKVAEK